MFDRNSCVIYIRHGESIRNHERTQAMSLNNTDDINHYKLGKTNPKYFDCPLSQKGVEECQESSKVVSKHQIHVVLVSPLRRALQTCDIIFKDHPSKPMIIVEPLLTETVHSASNFGTHLN